MSLFEKAGHKSKRLKILIFGPSGIGKTIFGLSFPSPAVVDAERGSDFYGNKFDFDRIQTADHRVVTSAINELLQDPGDRKTFVIDPYTKIDESIVLGHLVRQRIKKNNPNYSLQPLDYKTIKEERKLFINKLLSLDMNIIVTAPEKKEYSSDEADFMKVIGVEPEVPKDVPFMFDVVLEAYKDEDQIRMLRVRKDRTELLPATFELSYNKLVDIVGVEGLTRAADVDNQQKSLDETAGRNNKIDLDGKTILTAGITADQIRAIQVLVKDINTSKIESMLVDSYAVNSFLDLREDEAALFIETLNQ